MNDLNELNAIVIEGKKLHSEIKMKSARLEEIKLILCQEAEARGETLIVDAGDGSKAVVSLSPHYGPIAPEAAYNAVLDSGWAVSYFYSAVTVSITKLRDVLGAHKVKALQGAPIATKYSVSFK